MYVNVAAYSDWIAAFVEGENCEPAEGSTASGGATEQDGDSDAAGDDDDDEPSDLDSLFDCFTTVMELVQGLFGGGNAKGGGGGGGNTNNDQNNNKGDKTDGKGFVEQFLFGTDGVVGPAPGVVGNVQKFLSGEEDFAANVEAVGRAFGLDEALAETATNAESTTNNDGGR